MTDAKDGLMKPIDLPDYASSPLGLLYLCLQIALRCLKRIYLHAVLMGCIDLLLIYLASFTASHTFALVLSYMRIVFVLGYMSCMLMMTAAIIFGVKFSIDQAFKYVLRRSLFLVILAFVYYYTVLWGNLVFFVLGYYLMLAFVFCFVEFLLFQKGVVFSLIDSFALVFSNWFYVIVVMFLPATILFFLYQMLVAFVPGAFFTLNMFFYYVLIVMVRALGVCLLLSVLLALYHDLSWRNQEKKLLKEQSEDA